MANAQKYTSGEALCRVLNAGEDALKVDIDNVTLTTEGGDVAIDVALDKANDSVLIYGNTNKAGSGTSYVPLVDADGHLQVDTLSSALPSGAATAANQVTIIGHVDGVETLLTAIDAVLDTIDADTGAIKTAVELLDNSVDGNYLNVNANIAGTDFVGGAGAVAGGVQRITLASDDPAVVDLAAMEVLLTAANADHAANEVLLTAIDADTNAIKVDMAAVEVLLTAANVDHAANEALLITIDSDTNDIKTDIAALEVLSTAANVDLAEIEVATEATQSALEKMLYGNALVITAIHGSGSTQALGATYEALYVGVGGDVVVTMVGTGNFTFKNVASGQLLPIRITHVVNTNTTATNMIALKA